MANKLTLENQRREFLRLGITIASGIVLPAGFCACSKGDLQQTFVHPAMLTSENGLLDVTLTVAYLNTQLSGADPANKYPVSLRAYGYNSNQPSYAGPTLVVKGGDTLRIRLINQLPLNPPAAPNDPLLYMKPNTTNLHTHGLHVFPGIYSESKTAEYGDYAVDSSIGGVVPQGDSRQYVYDIPENHPAGPFYYHPQFHGSSAIQVASLMQGAIMVRGPVDELPEMAQATELIFLFQAPYFSNDKVPDNHGVKEGLLENFSQVARNPAGHGLNNLRNGHLDVQPVLINGVRQPTIVMQSGELQRWRFINTQTFNCLNLNLDGHVLHRYTMDGWGSSEYQEYADVREKGAKGIELAAGNRSSVVVKAGMPGTYLLRSLPVNIAKGKQSLTLPGDVLAKIIVVERRPNQLIAEKMPALPLPISDFLEPIGDEEFARGGGKKRSIIFNMSGGDRLTQSAGDKSPDYQLQRSNSIIQNVILDGVEEWTIFNFNSLSQPFHIHVNPMYVTKVNGTSIKPYWCDTVALPAGGTLENPTSITFRMRFNDYTGPYIMHSQMLQYSDLGMVQRVNVVPT